MPKKSPETFLSPIQPNTIGIYPEVPLATACLENGYIQAIICPKTERKTSTMTAPATVFNGISDCFYRNQLPAVLLVYPDQGPFAADLIEHLEKMFALGFFTDPSMVAERLPVMVVPSLKAFLPGLIPHLENLAYADQATLEAVIQQFSEARLPDPMQTQLPPVLGSTDRRVLTQVAKRGFECAHVA